MCNGKRIENNSFLFLKGFTGGECGTAVTIVWDETNNFIELDGTCHVGTN